MDDVAANYITVDTSAGTAGAEVRVIQADNSATSGPGLQSALKIVSSARFFRVLNTNGSTIVSNRRHYPPVRESLNAC